MHKRRILWASLWTAAAILTTTPSIAQIAKPIKIVIGYGPGTLDMLTRQVAQKLSERMGQPVIVETKAGANGLLAAEYVAKAEPDGYTILSTGTGGHILNAILRNDLRFNLEKDLMPLAMMMRIPMVLVVPPKTPVSNVGEFVSFMKQSKTNNGYASSGVGGSLHLAGAMLQDAAGLDTVHVPHKGESLALFEVMADRASYAFAGIGIAAPKIQEGAVKGLATTGQMRSSILPDIPTMKEVGYPNVDFSTWFAFFTPAHVPPAVAEKLEAELMKVLTSPEFVARAASLGAEGGALARAPFKQLIDAEFSRLRPLVKKTQIRLD